jgi:hypothetical protein
VKPKDILTADLSVELPTGPYRLHDSEGDINEPTIQPGSGSYDLLSTVHYAHHAFPGPWNVPRRRLPLERRERPALPDRQRGGAQRGSRPRGEWTGGVVRPGERPRASRDRFHGDDVPSTDRPTSTSPLVWRSAARPEPGSTATSRSPCTRT